MKLLIILLVGLIATVVVDAQNTSSGSVSGLVTDAQGAVIAGAEVILTDPSTNTSQTTSTNDVGRYSFVNVGPAAYDLTVSKTGFSQARLTQQNVQVGLTLTLDVTLQVGSTSTTVDVQASAAAELQTVNATVGTTINGV